MEKHPSFNPVLKYEGRSILFHKNGKKAEQVSYFNGATIGTAYYFYPNGRVKKVLDYPPNLKKGVINDNQNSNFTILDYFDSTGVQTVSKGNGYTVITNTDSMVVIEEGMFKDGKKDSIWKGQYKEAGHTYNEVYKQGDLISGVQILPDGSNLNYEKLLAEPRYKDGMKFFYKLFATTFIYPQDARNSGVKGKVIISFNVKIDGTITDIHVFQSLSTSIDNEAIRALKNTGQWIPAKFRVTPVNFYYKFPIDLNLNISSY